MLRLNADVLLYILRLSDIHTIVSLSGVNKLLHAVVQTKQLWIFLARDLCARCMMDQPIELLETLPTDQLMAEVKRAVAGPQTWSRTQDQSPTISRRVSIPIRRDKNARASSLFLPGERHILYYRWCIENSSPRTEMSCWDVYHRRRMWDYAQSGHVRAVTCDFYTQGKGVLCLLSRDAVTLLEVSMMSTDIPCEVFRFTLPGFMPDTEIRISGEYLAWEADDQRAEVARTVILVHWRSRRFVSFKSPCPQTTVDLLPGHMLVAYPTFGESSAAKFHLIPIASLATDVWEHLTTFDDRKPRELDSLTKVGVSVAGNDGLGDPERRVKLSLNPSRLHSSVFELAVLVADAQKPELPRGSVLARIKKGLGGVFSIGGQRKSNEAAKMYSKTVSRYHITLPESESNPRIPTSASVNLLSTQRHAAPYRVVDWFRYGFYCEGLPPKHETSECHRRRLVCLYRAKDAKDGVLTQPLVIPLFPDEAYIQPGTVRVADAGAVMAQGVGGLLVSYYL